MSFFQSCTNNFAAVEKYASTTSRSLISELCDSENRTLPAGDDVVPVKPVVELYSVSQQLCRG